MTANDDIRRPGGRAMQSTKPSLFAVLLRAIADWLSIVPGEGVQSGDLSRYYSEENGRLMGELAFARGELERVCAEQIQARQEANDLWAHIWEMAKRNVDLLDQCAARQLEAEYWRRVASGEDVEATDDSNKIIWH